MQVPYRAQEDERDEGDDEKRGEQADQYERAVGDPLVLLGEESHVSISGTDEKD